MPTMIAELHENSPLLHIILSLLVDYIFSSSAVGSKPRPLRRERPTEQKTSFLSVCRTPYQLSYAVLGLPCLVTFRILDM